MGPTDPDWEMREVSAVLCQERTVGKAQCCTLWGSPDTVDHTVVGLEQVGTIHRERIPELLGDPSQKWNDLGASEGL